MKRKNITQLVYGYNDMEALKNMSCEEASDILFDAHDDYISSNYIFPCKEEEFSKEEYNRYRIQCAFDIAYRALGAVGRGE